MKTCVGETGRQSLLSCSGGWGKEGINIDMLRFKLRFWKLTCSKEQ